MFNRSLSHDVVIIIVLIAGVFLGYQIHGDAKGVLSTTHIEDTPYDTEKLDLNVLYQAKYILERDFFHDDALNQQEMIYGAIKGLVASVGDVYTTYFTPDETKEFQDFIYSQLEGIGAELALAKDGFVTVITPLKNSPAEKAGIRAKDKILKIDDEPTGFDLFDAVKRIKGPAGTRVCLQILHEGDEEPADICVIRQFIDVPAVEWKNLGDGIFHVSLSIFDNTVAFELRNELELIKEQSPKGLILDLRNNGGGFLNGATEVVSLFLPEGKTVTGVQSRNGYKPNSELTLGDPVFTDLPMIVLVNGGSASASEILAAALSYYRRAELVGDKTFGKSTAQEIMNLSDGSSVRVTIAEWLTPAGDTIGDGIVPDVEVKDDLGTTEDEQLLKGVEILNSKF